MKTIASHSTQTKKSYSKPALVKHGNVSTLTKGKLGSLLDTDEISTNYSPDA